MKYKILLDMDGVLADFVQGMADWHGLEYPYNNPEETRWNLEDIWGISRSRMWKNVDSVFWEDLEKTEIADALVKHITDLFTVSSVTIVTAPPAINPGEAVTGKLRWMRWHFPQFANRMIFTEHKELCAGPDRLLIDDNQDNCEKFIRCGGKALLVPRPWNWRREECVTNIFTELVECQKYKK